MLVIPNCLVCMIAISLFDMSHLYVATPENMAYQRS